MIFDLDGTLYRADSSFVPAVVEAFQQARLEVPPTAEVLDLIGRPDRAFAEWLRARAGHSLAPGLAAAIEANEDANIGSVGRLYDGIPDALARLAERAAALAVASNGPAAYVDRVLSAGGVRSRFQAVRARAPGDASKADLVADVLVCLPNRPAIVVGDRASDVAAARAQGLQMVAVTYGYGSRDELRAADAHVADAAQLVEVVARRLERAA